MGRGSFGEVFKAFREHQYSAESGEGENTDLVEPVAVKVIQKHERIRTTKETRLLENEIGTLKRLQDHPNVARFISAEHCHTALELVLEFGGEINLRSYTKKQPNMCLTREVASQVFEQLIAAVAHVHEHNTVHRDLKPDNVQ